MKKYIVVLVAVGLFILVFGVIAFAQDMAWQDIGRGNLDIKAVLVHPDNPRTIYIGSKEKGIFKTEDAGASWRNIFSVRGNNRKVNFLSFALGDNNSLYAATGNGLYFSHNQGRSWNRLFKGKNYFENECTALAVLPSSIYLGTKAGLFVSSDKGRSWYRQSGEIGKTLILAIACNLKEPNSIYVACVDGVFKTKDGTQSWEKILAVHPVENENGDDAEEGLEERDEQQRNSNIRYISMDLNNLNYLYLATSRGVYKSQDRGKTWERLSGYGLLNREVKFLLISPKSVLYATTKAGVFKYEQERWYELSLGLFAQDISSLDLDNQGNLYAACDKGLFKSEIRDSKDNNYKNVVELYSKDEPAISEVQQAAIKYAEVESAKIKQWRKKAQMKAILPKLTVGLDRSESTNYEIYTSATTKYVYEGPRDKSNGWDVTLSWELGDLIWSDAQTSIDVRSRLMVQLRDDILDEVTKLYFERVRLKLELDNLSIEDRKKRFEKELKLQELAASLDALTGGYFSHR